MDYEHISMVIARIKQIDKELLELSDIAFKLSSDSSLYQDYEFIIREKRKPQQPTFFESPFFGTPDIYDALSLRRMNKKQNESPKISIKLKDSDVLSVVGKIHSRKLEERKSLLQSLEEIGVSIDDVS